MEIENIIFDVLQNQKNNKYDKIIRLIKNQSFEEALEEIRLVLAKGEEDREPLNWCLEGYIRFLLGENRAAERSFERACQLEPGNPLPLIMRAEFLIFQNEFEQAEKVAREILTYSENKEDLSQAYRILAKSIYYKSLPIIYNLGEIFELIDENFDSSSRGPFSEELNISEFNSNISEFISLLDATPEIFSEVEEGRKLINKSIQLSENNAESWYLRGCFERILGEDASQAIKSMERAVSLQPDNPIYWEELGQLYEGEANYRKAKEAYLKYYDLEIQPRELLIDSEDFLNLVLDVSEFSLALEVEESPFDGFKFEIKEALERSEIENSPDNLPPPSPISPGKAELEILPDGSSLVKMTLYQKNIEGMFHLDMDEEELISIIEDILLTIWNEFISSLELTGENSNVYDV